MPRPYEEGEDCAVKMCPGVYRDKWGDNILQCSWCNSRPPLVTEQPKPQEPEILGSNHLTQLARSERPMVELHRLIVERFPQSVVIHGDIIVREEDQSGVDLLVKEFFGGT